MEIINNICYLTIGDKVKRTTNMEGGLILKVIDTDNAIIEFFDDTKSLSVSDVIPLKVLSFQKYTNIQFYTEQKAKKKQRIKANHYMILDTIDLHAEVLFPDHFRTMSNENIIQKQLSHLCNYIEKAISQQLPNVTIIHGKGTGSLRSQVIDILESKYKLKNLNTSDLGTTTVTIS